MTLHTSSLVRLKRLGLIVFAGLVACSGPLPEDNGPDLTLPSDEIGVQDGGSDVTDAVSDTHQDTDVAEDVDAARDADAAEDVDTELDSDAAEDADAVDTAPDVEEPDAPPAPCAADHHVDDHTCVRCAADETNEAGDDPAGLDTECVIASVPGRLSVRDYGYTFWPGNHWETWNVYQFVRYVQTGYYGFAVDVSAANFTRLGLISEEWSADDALLSSNDVIESLPAASVNYSVIEDGTERVANGFFGTDRNATNPSQLVDMGRFMQQFEIPEVTYTGTDLEGGVRIAAMPRHVALTHHVTSLREGPTSVRIELEGEAFDRFPMTELGAAETLSIRDDSGNGWTFAIPEHDGATPVATRLESGGLRFESVFDATPDDRLALTVIAIPTTAGSEAQVAVSAAPSEAVTVEFGQLSREGEALEDLVNAEFDPERGTFVIPLRSLYQAGAPRREDWTNEAHHNWYNRHRIVVTNHGETAVSIPIAFDAGRGATYGMTGGSPMLRELDGEPTGIPVQISKNWHAPPSWFHLYTAIQLEPGTREFEHTFAHAKWGQTYAAAHAQLSLIGWDRNQQWDQSALGMWGESITYDPDFTLGRSMVDDVRPFLVDSTGHWDWTGNVGGANFLIVATDATDNRPEHQLSRIRSNYHYTGPNLTDVIYAGITRDGAIEARISTQLGRTDDLVRAWYHLEYTFLEDVDYDRLAFFQLTADRYGDNGFTRYAYGNEDGVAFDETVPPHETTGYASDDDRGIALGGEAPWVFLYANERVDPAYPEDGANVGFIVRDYLVEIGEEELTTPHINIYRTLNGGWSQMSFELGLPYDGDRTVVPAGSTVRATVEYVVPPADKTSYYGLSDYLTAMPAAEFSTTSMIQTLARENALSVEVTTGTLVRSHPVVLQAAGGRVAAQFELSGGLGYVPVTFQGLARPTGWRLERRIAEEWTPLDQSVEGNDFWQAYEDSTTGTYDLVFNVPNRGVGAYRLVR